MAQFHHIANIFANEVQDIVQEDAHNARLFHERDDPFQLADQKFIKLFCLSKELTRNLIVLVEQHSAPPSRTSALDSKIKVLTALRFFASGSYQMDISCNINMALSQSSVSRCINDVATVLNQEDVCSTWIKFPQNLREMQDIRNKFYRDYTFPGVIGCIDCTYVAIFPPKRDDPVHPEHVFVNRKGYHSINVQLICDSELRIIHCNGKYPGSTHDSFIWNNCNLLPILRRISERENSYYLLGDSGYGLRQWLLTPILNAEPGTPEERYNECHKRTRATIEHCNGVLKMRFRCLLKHRVLHYNPDMAAKIIKACVLLHNMCIQHNIPLEENVHNMEGDLDLGIYPENQDEQHVQGRIDPDLVNGRRLQHMLIQRHFN